MADSPLASSEHPAGEYPERDHEYDEDGTRTDRHQSLEHEARVEIDPVESSYAAWRGVTEQSAVQ